MQTHLTTPTDLVTMDSPQLIAPLAAGEPQRPTTTERDATIIRSLDLLMLDRETTTTLPADRPLNTNTLTLLSACSLAIFREVSITPAISL